MPTKYVRPYSKGQKNDFRDAEAIDEVVQSPTMKFVATKTVGRAARPAGAARVRDRLVSQRTGIISQIRAFLLERDIAVRQGQPFQRAELPDILATPADALSPQMARIFEDFATDWRHLDERINHLSSEIHAMAHADTNCERPMSVALSANEIVDTLISMMARSNCFN
jgi:transposase